MHFFKLIPGFNNKQTYYCHPLLPDLILSEISEALSSLWLAGVSKHQKIKKFMCVQYMYNTSISLIAYYTHMNNLHTDPCDMSRFWPIEGSYVGNISTTYWPFCCIWNGPIFFIEKSCKAHGTVPIISINFDYVCTNRTLQYVVEILGQYMDHLQGNIKAMFWLFQL